MAKSAQELLAEWHARIGRDPLRSDFAIPKSKERASAPRSLTARLVDSLGKPTAFRPVATVPDASVCGTCHRVIPAPLSPATIAAHAFGCPARSEAYRKARSVSPIMASRVIERLAREATEPPRTLAEFELAIDDYRKLQKAADIRAALAKENGER